MVVQRPSPKFERKLTSDLANRNLLQHRSGRRENLNPKIHQVGSAMIYTVGRACRAGRSIKKLFVNINGTPLVCAILILASGGCQPTVSRWRTFKKKNRELTSNATNLSFWKSHGLEFISSGAPVENPLLHGQNHPFRLSPLGIAMDTIFGWAICRSRNA